MSIVDNERLKADLRMIAEDIDQLLRDVSLGAGERGGEFRRRLQGARERLDRLEQGAADQLHEATVRTGRFVHEQPWRVVGAAAAVAFVLGMLSGRPRG